MCGRFAMNNETNDLITEFVAQGGRADDWAGSYSIAPTQKAPIVRERADAAGTFERGIEVVRWDWPKPPNRTKGAPIINARIEKLATGFWTGAFSNSRCIVPMIGYYEWTGPKGDKQPHFIHGDGLLAAAGLTWTMEVDGELQRVFVVITREARDASGEVHDRMPAFLTKDLWQDWLNIESLTDTTASKQNRLEMIDALTASSESVASTMQTYEVERRVNNSRTAAANDASLIVPLQ
jgi:putative SOS response-associated peptidase YedK